MFQKIKSYVSQTIMNLNVGSKLSTHYTCRNNRYPRNPTVLRFPVPDNKVSWEISWSEYNPVEFTSLAILNKPWSDPPLDEPGFNPQWNTLDGSINRKSHCGAYKVENGVPLNPIGRTGLIGRGHLGRWGPNHAVDPIVTRWKRNSRQEIERDSKTGKPVLQFVSIERRDCHEWALPGGMVDPGEHITSTLKREFMEEALNSLCSSDNQKAEMETLVEEFFVMGIEIYRGYVDDPRNTDNSWMETVAMNFHDENGTFVGKLKLSAGDDATKVRWMDVSSSIKLYASHRDFLQSVAELRKSFW